MTNEYLKAVLFDLDGVVVDTESQYSLFWGGVCRHYFPDDPGLENRIKGQTLTQIIGTHFASIPDAERDIVKRLDDYESQMHYDYFPGFLSFIGMLREKGVRTAVVTSSNQPKMACVYRAHPDFKQMFDAILTSEDFDESKPSPDCFLKAAARLGVSPRECLVCEDSFNGLRAGRAAGMTVLGLATTNPADSIAGLCDRVVPHFLSVDVDFCEELVRCRLSQTR